MQRVAVEKKSDCHDKFCRSEGVFLNVVVPYRTHVLENYIFPPNFHITYLIMAMSQGDVQ